MTSTLRDLRTGLARGSLLLALVAAGAAGAPTALFAQSETLPGFAEVLDVRVVNVEVVVTDKQGQRIHGLSQADFLLEVDGRPTPIDFYSEVRNGTARTEDGVPAPGGHGAEAPVANNLLLFIDEFFSTAQDRDRVLERVIAQLPQLEAEDRVAAVAFDGKELTLLSRWTTDHAAFAGALEVAKRRPAHGLQRVAERRTSDASRRDLADQQLLTIERIRFAGGPAPEQPFARVDLDLAERTYAYRLTSQLERAVVAATSAMRSFAGAQGRKVLLLTSGGWPFEPAEFTVGSLSPEVEQARAGTLQTFFSLDLYSPLVDTANLTGFTLYPIDVPGNRAALGQDATVDTGEFTRLAPGASIAQTGTPREQQVHSTLDYLADRTGGLSMRNAWRDTALARVLEDTRSYYWLGFSPQRAADDQRHRIKVSIRGRPDLVVRFRDSYLDQSRRNEITMVVESALLFGDPPSAKPLRLHFGKPRKSIRRVRVPLEVGIDMRYVTLVPNQGRYRNTLEIRIVAMSEAGERSSTTLDQIPIDGAAPPKPGQFMVYETELSLRKVAQRIVVAVFDPLSGELLSSSGELDV